MNQWLFIIAAYAITGFITLALTMWSWIAMRRAEVNAKSLEQ